MIDNADIDKLLSTPIPGGSQARDWFLPHDTERGLENVRDVVRRMITSYQEMNNITTKSPDYMKGYAQGNADTLAIIKQELAARAEEENRLRSIIRRYFENKIILERELAEAREDNESNITEHNRLVRELDVIWNGEKGAAKQASLCDIVAQIKREHFLEGHN